jgi:hypothetical protein
LTIEGGTAAAGMIGTIEMSTNAKIVPGLCNVWQKDGEREFGLGHGIPSASRFTITAEISAATSTVTVDYSCQRQNDGSP